MYFRRRRVLKQRSRVSEKDNNLQKVDVNGYGCRVCMLYWTSYIYFLLLLRYLQDNKLTVLPDGLFGTLAELKLL